VKGNKWPIQGPHSVPRRKRPSANGYLSTIFPTVRPTATLYLVGTCGNELLMVLGALCGHSKGRLFISTTFLVLRPCGQNAAPPNSCSPSAVFRYIYIYIILSRVSVTIDGVWIRNWIYWTLLFLIISIITHFVLYLIFSHSPFFAFISSAFCMLYVLLQTPTSSLEHIWIFPLNVEEHQV
jgi:hypothetical protein